MSANLVLCVTDEVTTIRLTKYQCKPVIFINLLGSLLAEISTLNIADVIVILKKNGFEVEEKNEVSFSVASMNTPLIINWAWLLDLKNKELKYWDVIAAESGIEETLSAPSLDPSDCLLRMTLSEKSEMETALNKGIGSVQETGISVVNHPYSKKSD